MNFKKLPVNLLIATLAIFVVSCTQQDDSASPENVNSLEYRSGAIQISGLGEYATLEECDWPSEGADFAFTISGDLDGCWYAYVTDYECSPSGTYREEGVEHFVGTYDGEYGEFWTTYKFEAKFEGCEDGFFVGAEIFGRCQHPIQKDSGTGVFENVSGIIFFKDDIEAGNFPYRGHLRWSAN